MNHSPITSHCDSYEMSRQVYAKKYIVVSFQQNNFSSFWTTPNCCIVTCCTITSTFNATLNPFTFEQKYTDLMTRRLLEASIVFWHKQKQSPKASYSQASSAHHQFSLTGCKESSYSIKWSSTKDGETRKKKKTFKRKTSLSNTQ